jgi:hypothetical protein
VQVLAAAALLPRAPRSLWIPLFVAGMIIFNTMMNSIAERKKEIHVYTSLGLAPVHVGAIFLAEALTYGLMGGMFGYVVGQGCATMFNALGWMGNVTLNYSGTQVINTMVLVQAVVVISALVPAGMAARLASPSRETGWRLPEPDGDTIRDMLPFTATHGAAPGVLAFLYEYFDAHTEGSIGHFTAADVSIHGKESDSVGSVTATVWLAPYDVGVRQDVKVVLRPAPDDGDICDIHVELRQSSGEPRNWFKLNRVFIGGLRNQMLGWRSVSPKRVMSYIEAGNAATGRQD